MKIKKILKKTFISFVLFNLILWNLASGVQALFGGGPSVPSTGEVLDKIEKRYGFDGNILRRSSLKTNYPQVEVFFDQTAPKTGEKVTATALPQYFKTSNENLYYTWFLFREGDDLKSSKVVEEAKIRAMGIIARGDFDPFLFGTDYSDGGSDDDKDGYEASFGGGDGVGAKDTGSVGDYESDHYSDEERRIVNPTAITRCYKHNFGVSGTNKDSYENVRAGEDLIEECEHKFPEAPKGESFVDPLDSGNVIVCQDDYEIGDGEFTNNEEACWKLDPTNADTDGDGIEDEADLAGLGQTQFTWSFQEGDRVGLIIEGTSTIPTNEEDGSGKSAVIGEALERTITYSCEYPATELDFCLDENSSIGECWGGECLTRTDCSSTPDGLSCNTGDNEPGTCEYGSCVAVGGCIGASQDGELCSKTDGRVGTCEANDCVVPICKVEGEACQTDTGREGVCNEYLTCDEIMGEPSTTEDQLTPYYKILWAGLDVCDDEKIDGEDEYKLVKDDECGGEADYGYMYLATKTVAETNDNLLKSSLVFFPQEPQADHLEYDYSDYITVKAGFSQSDINDDFIYYDWDIYYCYEDEIENGTCTENIGRKLTASCDEDSLLGSCADSLESDSIAEGMGMNEIKFRGTEDFYNTYQDSEKLYFKVFLRAKKDKDSKGVGLSTVDIPVGKNNVGITFLELTDNGGNYTAEEICTSGNYSKVCPVYSGQLLAIAHKKDPTVDIEGFVWEVDDETLVNKNNAIAWTPSAAEYDDYIIVPIQEDGMTIRTVSLNTKKQNGEENVSERIISATEPMTKIASNDTNKARYLVVDDGSETGKTSENVMIGKIGETISLKADLVPDYLNGLLTEKNISLKWYINGIEVTSDFVTDNPDYNIVIDNQNLEFTLKGEEGETVGVEVEVIKEYSEDEELLLNGNWGLTNFSSHSTKRSIIIKQITSFTTGVLANKNSMTAFMASTFQNAPDYFVFAIRTAIVFVLFWSLVYGFDYWTRNGIKLEK